MARKIRTKQEKKKRMKVKDFLNGEKENYEGMMCNERID